MRFIVILALLASTAAEQRAIYPPKGSAEQRDIYEKGQAAQKRFEQRLFEEAGFRPLDSYASTGRAVIRALFEGPYMMLPMPGFEIERARNGKITLTVIGRAGQRTSTPMPASTWTQLVSKQGSLFKPRPYVPWDPPKADEAPEPAPPICHGWEVRFGKTDKTGVGSGSWGTCSGDDQPGSAYAKEIARVAVSARPSCRFEAASPFKSFADCFSPPYG